MTLKRLMLHTLPPLHLELHYIPTLKITMAAIEITLTNNYPVRYRVRMHALFTTTDHPIGVVVDIDGKRLTRGLETIGKSELVNELGNVHIAGKKWSLNELSNAEVATFLLETS